MRDFLFRAWDIRRQEMFYGVENAYDTLGTMTNSKGKEIYYTWESFGDVLYDDKQGKLFLMQNTGLKDKNGKPIFVGDMVKTSIGNQVVTDLFCNFVIYTYEDIDKMNQPEKHLEVIGNIYEKEYVLNA